MALKMYQKSENPPLSTNTNVIGIAAGKGGVGKSSVTVNLALALKRMGFTVGVMDTDIYGPSIRKMLPENRLPSQKGQVIVPALCEGIRMISMAYFRQENEAAVVRAPIANGVITQFIKQVEWGSPDYLLIDFPPGTGDIQLTLCQQANLSGALMVTTPQEVAVMDVRKAMHMFHQVKTPILGIVENMSYYYHQKTDEKLYIFGKGGGERLALESGVPYLGGIPLDPTLCRSGDLGQSLFSQDPENCTPVVQAFMSIAGRLVQQVSALKSAAQDGLSNFELKWKEMT